METAMKLCNCVNSNGRESTCVSVILERNNVLDWPADGRFERLQNCPYLLQI